MTILRREIESQVLGKCLIYAETSKDDKLVNVFVVDACGRRTHDHRVRETQVNDAIEFYAREIETGMIECHFERKRFFHSKWPRPAHRNGALYRGDPYLPN